MSRQPGGPSPQTVETIVNAVEQQLNDSALTALAKAIIPIQNDGRRNNSTITLCDEACTLNENTLTAS